MKKTKQPARPGKKSSAVPPKLLSARKRYQGLRIVGLGASAGGLEALELFFGHVPADSGLAFVVVQHLDPTRKGIMVEPLQRATAMPVVQIRDRMPVKADHVYVIPPDSDLSILNGVLHLLEPSAPRGLRLPIDFSSVPWPMTSRNIVWASCSRAWVRTAPWACAPSRSGPGRCSRRIRARPNSAPCRAMRLIQGWST